MALVCKWLIDWLPMAAEGRAIRANRVPSSGDPSLGGPPGNHGMAWDGQQVPVAFPLKQTNKEHRASKETSHHGITGLDSI